MTSFPNWSLWHVRVCHVTVFIYGDAWQGAVSIFIGMWITGFGTLRMFGDLVTPEYSLLF